MYFLFHKHIQEPTTTNHYREKIMTQKEKRIATIKQIPKIYPGIFTESSIRWLVFNEKTNGFYKCVRRIGRRVLIDLDQFEQWIDSQTEKK